MICCGTVHLLLDAGYESKVRPPVLDRIALGLGSPTERQSEKAHTPPRRCTQLRGPAHATLPGEHLPSAIVRCVTSEGAIGRERCILYSGKRVQKVSGDGCITITVNSAGAILRSVPVQVMIGIYLLQNTID